MTSMIFHFNDNFDICTDGIQPQSTQFFLTHWRWQQAELAPAWPELGTALSQLVYFLFATLGPSWNFSLAENQKSLDLQDGPWSGITFWIVTHPTTNPPNHRKRLRYGISQQPLIRSSQNFEPKFRWPNQNRKCLKWREVQTEIYLPWKMTSIY